MPRWGPAKPKTRIKVVECGADEQDHGLDIPYGIHTTDFKITGTGHEWIEEAFDEGCRIIAGRSWLFREASANWRSPPGYVSTLARSSCSTPRLGRL